MKQLDMKFLAFVSRFAKLCPMVFVNKVHALVFVGKSSFTQKSLEFSFGSVVGNNNRMRNCQNIKFIIFLAKLVLRS